MRICLAQLQAIRGNIDANIHQHIQFIEAAISEKSHLIVFPELSIIGYEPSLAQDLAVQPTDPRFDIFQEVSDRHNVAIAVGAPLQMPEGICIGLMLFQAHQNRQFYLKQYLHTDEMPYFISGKAYMNSSNKSTHHFSKTLTVKNVQVAFAICYELSVDAHVQDAIQNGMQVYLASSAKTQEGVQKAAGRLADIAKTHQITSLMVNNVGPSEDFVGAGQSAIWNKQGQLLAKLSHQDGLLIFDTETQQCTKIIPA